MTTATRARRTTTRTASRRRATRACRDPAACRSSATARDDDGDCAIDEDASGVRFQVEDFIETPSVARPADVIRQCLAVPPIAEEAQETFTLQGNLDLAGGVLDDMAVEVGPSTDTTIDLGIVWRERAPDGTSAIGFRRATLELVCTCAEPAGGPCDATCGAPLTSIVGLVDATSPQQVTAGPGDYGAPSIAFASAGFLEERLGRDGQTLATPETGGGWFVAWLDEASDLAARTVRVRRFAARDGLAIEPCEAPATCGYEITEDPTLRGAFPASPNFPLVFPDLRLGDALCLLRPGQLAAHQRRPAALRRHHRRPRHRVGSATESVRGRRRSRPRRSFDPTTAARGRGAPCLRDRGGSSSRPRGA